MKLRRLLKMGPEGVYINRFGITFVNSDNEIVGYLNVGHEEGDVYAVVPEKDLKLDVQDIDLRYLLDHRVEVEFEDPPED